MTNFLDTIMSKILGDSPSPRVHNRYPMTTVTAPPVDKIDRPLDVMVNPLAVEIGDVRGQTQAKIKCLIAISGRHNIIFVGPPGEGKTTLAHAMTSISEPLSFEEHLELSSVHADLPTDSTNEYTLTPRYRPFIQVGPGVTETQLLGGGRSEPHPGLISLATHGILFMDEITGYDRKLIEKLRVPLEQGFISVSRGGIHNTFPAWFQLVGSMNPCPCGYHGFIQERCTCTCNDIRRYVRKLSGPILDRIDMIVEVPPITSEEHLSEPIANQSHLLLRKVRQAQGMRESRGQILPNSRLPAGSLFAPRNCFMRWTDDSLQFLKDVSDQPGFSSRRRIRLARIARTIADLYGHENIQTDDVREADIATKDRLIG
jgi:magnesium chelatase family protein